MKKNHNKENSLFHKLPVIDGMVDPLIAEWNQKLLHRVNDEQLINIADFSQMNDLFENFLNAVGLPVAIIDLNGVVLASSRWQKLCMNFHRVHQGTLERCIQSDIDIWKQIEEGKSFSFHKCKNGLIDCSSPIIIEDKHIANLFIGQFFSEKPDESFFEQMINDFGFDKEEYLKAVHEVPIVSQEKLEPLLKMLVSWAKQIAEKTIAESRAKKMLEFVELEVKKRTYELEEQKKEFEAIFEYSKDGIAVFNEDSRFLDCNEAYLQMSGFTKEELLSKSCIELTVPEDKERTKEMMKTVFKEGFVENFEKSCILKDDKIIVVNMTLSLMPDKKRIIAVVKNITQNKFFESQAKLASMGEMIGNIAHHWRQPLTVISSLASLLIFKKEFGKLDIEDIVPNMNQIISQTTFLSETIDNFRNFVRDGEAKGTLNVATMFEKIISIENSILLNSNIQLISSIDPMITMFGYENKLMEACINIINNSKDVLVTNQNLKEKYIFINGKITNNYCEISIKDNGGGIPLSIINRIFEPYFTTKFKSRGTGLGLSMAHKIITEMFEGSINVSNTTFKWNQKEYNGAVFIISLPLLK